MKRVCAEDRYGTFGARVGSSVGAFVGNGVQMAAKSFFGLGDYSLKSNSLINGGGGTMPENVTIIPKGNNQTRIMFREYLGDIITSSVAGAFSASTFSLNPGIMQSFPWLASVAQNYDQWIPNGIVFEFRSTCTDYSATNTQGAVMMATEYDPIDNAFGSKQEMMNCAYSNEGKITDRVVHGVECDPRQTPKQIYYVRQGNIPSGADIREYDLGKFVIATQGCPVASANLGSLYVYYDITFQKEQLYNGRLLKGSLNAYGTVAGANWSDANPIGNATPSVAGIVWTQGNYTPAQSANTLGFGNYLSGAVFNILFEWSGTAAAAYVDPTITGTGCTVDVNFQGPNDGTGSLTTLLIINVRITSDISPSILLGSGTLPAGTRNPAKVQIHQISAAYNTLY